MSECITDQHVVCDDVDSGQFFAPVDHDMITSLASSYRRDRALIESLAQTLQDPTHQGLLSYFLEGNIKSDRYRITDVTGLFDAAGAIGALNATYWNRALQMTDVLDCMPQSRRDEWFCHIREQSTPEFTEQAARSTLADLLASRARFLAERVDGIFRALSPEHITNSPQGFGKRMILCYAMDSMGYPNHSRAGIINDLRAVIAKLMGRGEMPWDGTYPLLRHLAARTGQWCALDGGALKMRLYKKGTAHIEVHPDMAWRLNQILAYLYPAAIASEFRRPAARRSRAVELIQKPLAFAVLGLLRDVRVVPDHRPGHFACFLPVGAIERPHAAKEAWAVLKALGAVPSGSANGHMIFDYNPASVLSEVVMTGCVPEHKSHQFYPTPGALAQRVRAAAQIEPHHRCLEPSAGLGALIAGMDPKQVTCVEASALHASVLREKGYTQVHQMDFLRFAQSCAERFDRVLMNPPFDNGRWQAHLEAAAGLVAQSGRLVAILPSGSRSRVKLPGFECVFSSAIDGAFEGASVSVVMLVASRCA